LFSAPATSLMWQCHFNLLL